MALTIKPRSAWTTSKAAGNALTKSKIVGVVVHHPGDGDKTYAKLNDTQVAGRLKAYRNYHVNSRGWAVIGYNFAVDQRGGVWTARGGDRIGAHANPYNTSHLGVLLIIGDKEKASPACVEAFLGFR
jgi:hypothetical protein